MADDYELQNIATYRLRELLQHEKDNRALRTVNAELLAALKRAVDTIHAWHADRDAPLAACQGALDTFREWEGPEEDIPPVYGREAAQARNQAVRAYEAIRAAIAKAEGR